jgi:CRISPR-associated protein Cmr6
MSNLGTVEAPDGSENKQEREVRRQAAQEADWQTLQSKSPRIEQEWIPLKNQKRVALRAATGMGKTAVGLLSALTTRRNALGGPATWNRSAQLIAPLATGLGNPHPVENGFAFLSPYGVPYLAGSGIKGVLRRAAEELALFEADGRWSIAHVWALFGFDENSAYLSKRPAEMIQREREKLSPVVEETIIRWRNAYDKWVKDGAATDCVLGAWKREIRKQLPKNYQDAPPEELAKDLAGATGAGLRRLIHWQGLIAVADAFPDDKANLTVDILNPHHKAYYEGNGTPNDAENPLPVFFLTLAAGAHFTFSVQPLPSRAAVWQAIGDHRALLDAAFEHARDWLGFGAKTAVGYGAMIEASPASQAIAQVPGKPATQEPALSDKTKTHPPVEEIWPTATLLYEPGPSLIKAEFKGKTTAGLKVSDAKQLIAGLGENFEQLKKKKQLKPVAVKVRTEGNLVCLIGLAEQK